MSIKTVLFPLWWKQNSWEDFMRKNIDRMTNYRVVTIMIFFIVIVALVISNVLFTMISGKHFRSGKNVLSYNQDSNYVTEKVIAKRGSIYDRNKEVIAQDIEAYDLYAIVDKNRVNASDEPAHVVDVEQTAKALAPILDCTSDDLKTYLENAIKNGSYQTEFGAYGKRLSAQQKEDIEALKLPGLEFSESTNRVYPIGTFASQLIGFAQYDYTVEAIKGVMGIEQIYDDQLCGKDGEVVYQKDSQGYYLPKTKKYTKTAENGNDIYLTIDKNVQLAVEEALKKTMESNNAQAAWAVVMEAKTGKILAQAGYPTFDLNEREEINYMNIPSQMMFECGSVLKPFVIAGAMNEGVYNGTALFNSKSASIGLDANGNLAAVAQGNSNWLMTVNDALGKDYGTITYDEGLIRSTNTVIANLFMNYYNVNTNIEYLKKFGFFQDVDMEGVNEASGLLNEDSITSKVTLGYGQGSTVTTYQLLQGYAALFGDGCTVKPYVIDKIVDPNTGETIYQGKTEKSDPIISEAAVAQIKTLLRRVVTEDYGTAKSYEMSDVALMAKTGTGEIAQESGGYSRDIFTSSIMAAAPAEDPEIIIYYAFQSGNIINYSREYFKEIVREALLAVDGYSNASNNTTETITSENYNVFTMPQLVNHSLSYASQKLSALTNNIITIGDGSIIISQYPSSNTKTISSQKVFLLSDGSNITMPNMIGWTRKDVELFSSMSGISIKIAGSGYVNAQNVNEGTIINDASNVEVTLK